MPPNHPIARPDAMTSWRETASIEAQDDLDGLLNVVLPLAENHLRKRGEFYPFSASISTTGEPSLAAADPGDMTNSAEVLAALLYVARSEKAGNRAVAIVADVLANGFDGVRVELEHREEVAIVVLLPYSRSRFKKTLTFGQLSASADEPKIWVVSKPPYFLNVCASPRLDGRLYSCPSCGHETLDDRGGYDVCSVCSVCSVCGWEDDGQDLHDSSRVRGGPNGPYSLDAWREQFASRPGNQVLPHRPPSAPE